MKMIEKVAKALAVANGFYEEHWTLHITDAKAAIEAMRDLVKSDPNGNREEDLIVNRYIDAALKE